MLATIVISISFYSDMSRIPTENCEQVLFETDHDEVFFFVFLARQNKDYKLVYISFSLYFLIHYLFYSWWAIKSNIEPDLSRVVHIMGRAASVLQALPQDEVRSDK